MLSKLEKYASFIKLSHKQRLDFIKAARPSEQFRAPLPGANDIFSEQDFAHLHVFDSKKVEMIYKIKTYRQKANSSSPRAVVALFHGLKSHANRGAHLAKYFSSRNIETVGMDFRGFGKSEGLSGYIQNFETQLNDSLKFVERVKTMYPKVPIFGLGLSLGGATAYHLSLKHKDLFKGTVLMAPALEPSVFRRKSISQLLLLVNCLQWFIPNNLKIIPTMNPEDSCKNPNYNEFCKKDPLFLNDMHRLRTIGSVLELLKESQLTFQDYDVPFMVVQGGMDKVIDPQVAFDLFSKSKTPEDDKEILFYENMWHDVWHEPEIEEIQKKVADWVLLRASLAK